MQQNNKIIGITGITGSGTSTVSKMILTQNKAEIIEADKLAHKITNEKAQEIAAVFGNNILTENQEINRQALGQIVFGNKSEMEKLEKIIHPPVIAEVKRLINKDGIIIIDAPLLIESGLYKICQSIWLITSSNENRINRLMFRNGLNEEEALIRINSRQSDSYLSNFATAIIENNHTLKSLQEKVHQALRKEFK